MTLLEGLNHYLPKIDSSIYQVWKSKRTILGEQVYVLKDGHKQLGTAVDFLLDGALLVDYDGKLEKVYAADVQVRRLIDPSK